MAEKLTTHYRTIEALENASVTELAATPEVGGVIAESVAAWFQETENRAMIERLRAAGVQLALTGEAPQAASDRLAGLTFVLSGVFEEHSREELQHLIQQHGGKVTGSISKKLSYLVAGDKMGPAKREKATDLKVPIITEAELLAMLPKATEAIGGASEDALPGIDTPTPSAPTTAPETNPGQQGSLF